MHISRKIIRSILGVLVFFFTSCILPTPAFVTPIYEPVLVREKGDMQINASLEPFKYLSFSNTYAVKDWIVVRASVGGLKNNTNYCANLIFIKRNISGYRFFGGPIYNYQRNTIKGDSHIWMGTFRQFKYNATFNSIGFVNGVDFPPSGRALSQVVIQINNTFVSKYEYSFYSNNGSGKSSYFQVTDDEQIQLAPFNAWSIATSYNLVIMKGKWFSYRFQVGLDLFERKEVHNYEFKTWSYPAIATKSKVHPANFPIHGSFGLIFKFPTIKNWY